MKLAIAILGVFVVLENARVGVDALNCDLKNGYGCYSDGPHFYMSYVGQSPGGYADCRLNYKLRVQLDRSTKGFYCYFITKTPSSGRNTYTISHDNSDHDSPNTPWIEVTGADAKFRPQRSFSEPYSSNFWSYEDFHNAYGQSWTYYKFTKDKLYYYSDNLKHSFQSGHPNLFEPQQRTTYIGLNRKYESSVNRGKGLCQIYCQVISSYGGRNNAPAFASASNSPDGAAGEGGAGGAGGEGGEGGAPPPPPAGPPASGRTPSLGAANEENGPPPPPPRL